MSRPPSPVFLERRGYRRRRLNDAIRVLPVVGALLFLEPLFWTGSDGAPARTTSGVVYIFAVWALLVIAAFFASRAVVRLGNDPEDPAGPES